MDFIAGCYKYQFTYGCEKIDCCNQYCSNCSKFIYADLSDQEKYLNAQRCAVTHNQTNNLCPDLPYCILHPEHRAQQETFKNFVLKFIVKDLSKERINTKETIEQLRQNFLDFEKFCCILPSNDQPLSIFNSAIDDDLLYDFSSKLSSIPHLNAAVLDVISNASKKLLSQVQIEKYSQLRALLLLFYFPAIIAPSCFSIVLEPLLIMIGNLSKRANQILKNWLSTLPKLFVQIVGASHVAISMYFSMHSHPNPHSTDVSNYLKTLSVYYDVNSLFEKPFSPSIFYNHHINEAINLEEELELKQNHKPSILKTPYVLSIKTKAAICQLESEHFMGIGAYRSFLLNTFGSRSNNDLFLTLRIRRDHLVDDAVTQLSIQNSFSFLKKLRIIFEGEHAIDVGGPSREFLYLVSERLFSPDHGMFVIVNDKYHWFSQCSFEGDRSFFLVGAVVGLAIHNSIVLPIRFPRVIYKRLLTPQNPLTLNDLREIDSQLASSLSAIVDMVNRNEDVSALCLTFSTTIDCFGDKVIVPLVDGMEDVEVCNENVDFYIGSYINFMLVKSIESHFDAFRRGFELSCRTPSYKLLDPAEIDILVSGEEVLDWGALKRGAVYKDGYTAKSRAVKWFWEIFENFSTKQKLMFLKFATGTDRAPVGGLGKMKLVIQRGADYERLPISHTCFNTFTLPDYRSKNVMFEKVMLAIQHTEGFGIV
ncbi:putative E3 ubiquitin-protein ligase HECTD2 [Tritrichomonas foetus]|uniref:HECT-type E3 ubiquitin transferase n=1 Tax=Tritrichomonas foetus TaxID=1144522 RepID=A0A1J4J9X0_9EUKA|nr:putative E3 ubiquitin-protein ligase HECTD2 [Tritrichomonas foetus]|eukprot:OHS95015.1 putative E3 ubiquitin-protein ligase HECTD2 [Tritrichomonas foetus]